jgi:2,3-dihydro-2,3-dihydroxybenzoate dehydrogenase
MMQLTGLQDSVCVVTGAARGIGLGVAKALAASGARLALFDRDGEALFAAATGLGGNDKVFHQAVDVTDAVAVKSAVQAVVDEFGRIDKLVNVAGIQHLDPLIDCPVEHFDATFTVNVRGTFLMTQAVARAMVSKKSGAIVTVSSNAALVPRVKQGSYCSSKAAVSHLMRVFALELAPSGIRCNCVAPGSTETEMIRKMMSGMGFQEQLLKGSLDNFRVGIPLGKNAQVEDVANSVLFLLSDQAGHITMHELVVDGGGSLGA